MNKIIMKIKNNIINSLVKEGALLKIMQGPKQKTFECLRINYFDETDLWFGMHEPVKSYHHQVKEVSRTTLPKDTPASEKNKSLKALRGVNKAKEVCQIWNYLYMNNLKSVVYSPVLNTRSCGLVALETRSSSLYIDVLQSRLV